MILVFDTETTGKADFHRSPDHPCQPRIVQLGALLLNVEGEELMSLNVIIKPDGWVIPKEASDIHGITQEIAERDGVAEIEATKSFDKMLMCADVAVAHNFDFDHLVLSRGSVIRERELRRKGFCTMKALTDVCQLPGPYGFKWPKLQEAHQFAFGSMFEGAHDAMADVRATARLYLWMQESLVSK